jgi:hypothetical protein
MEYSQHKKIHQKVGWAKDLSAPLYVLNITMWKALVYLNIY